jgi:hypothetical protein
MGLTLVSSCDGRNGASTTVTCGVGADVEVDEVRVVWPSGSVQRRLDIPANRELVIREVEVTDVGEMEGADSDGLVAQPNPFNGMVRVVVTMKEAGELQVGIYDVSGRRKRIVTDGGREAGSYEFVWDGKDASGSEMASGVYFVRMRTSGMSRTIKLMLVK